MVDRGYRVGRDQRREGKPKAPCPSCGRRGMSQPKPVIVTPALSSQCRYCGHTVVQSVQELAREHREQS